MSWLDRTSFGDHVKNMSYGELIEAFGDKKGADVAKHFGIKKERKKKTFKKDKEEDGGE